SQVDGRQIERQAQQVVAQGTGDEFVDLVAHLPCHATDDGASRNTVLDGYAGAVVAELQRVEEALDQADMVVGKRRVEAIDGLGQHRVAEAVNHVCKFGNDRGIEGDVVSVRNQEHVDVGLDLAGELLEHE